MIGGLLVAPIEQVLTDPRYFPARINLASDRLTMVQTSRERMAAAPFLDGRTAIAEGASIDVPLSEALATPWMRPRSPDRYIFHLAFCGSTLLATLLDVSRQSFAVREPRALVDLADAAVSAPPSSLGPALALTRALLRRSWHDGEQSFCKPSNWVNNLIPALTTHPADIRPLFIATDKRSYLYALFRGGRARMEYVARATDHLLRSTRMKPDLWQRALTGVGDPLEASARIGLLSMHIQLELFDNAMRRGGWGRAQLLTHGEIENDPMPACRFACRALDLDIPTHKLEQTIAERFSRYAKAPELPYLPADVERANRQVERRYGQVMDRAMDWAALSGLKNDCAILVRPTSAAAA